MQLRNNPFVTFTACLLITLAYAGVLHAEEFNLFVLAGQSNMEGAKGNAERYPADPKGIDQKVKFYWGFPKHSTPKESFFRSWWGPPKNITSNGEWTFLQPQGGRFSKGHFGPEVTLARQLAENHRNIAIFKYAIGATSLADNWKAPGQNGIYDQMVADLQKAVELLQQRGHKVVFRALIWIQGESDATTKEMADAYGDRLKSLIEDFRMNVARNTTLPVILGVDEQHPRVKNFPQIVGAQQKLAKEGRNIVFTSMIGLEKADHTHLTPSGLEEHGRRLFAAWMTMPLNRRQDANSGGRTPLP